MLAAVREPVVAGRFYPADPAALYAQVDAFLGESPADEHAYAVIAPHAGYLYSGAIAGSVYARVHVPRTVIVLGPNHTGRGANSAILTRGSFSIPGAEIPIDSTLALRLRDAGPFEEDAAAHRFEHSLEVHLPFLYRRNPELRIVPICLGSWPYARCAEAGHAIAEVARQTNEEPLIVASTDMSHYISAEEAARLDRLALQRLLELDAEGLYRTVAEQRISMCGFIPSTVTLVAARGLGAQEAELVRYGSSGDVTGDYSSVVAYAAALVR